MDAYQILGLKPGATEDEAKAAYRTLAQKYNPELYEAGPLREDAEKRMDELNHAFDTVMAQLRGVQPAANPQNEAEAEPAPQEPCHKKRTRNQTDSQPNLAEIRAMIQQGRVDEALAELNAMPDGSANAEWNFLMGSAYYYKGWLQEALHFFAEACRLAPSNREYAAALHNLKRSAEGEMPGNPYGGYAGGAQASAVGCSCCEMCTFLMCMDTCCSIGRGC